MNKLSETLRLLRSALLAVGCTFAASAMADTPQQCNQKLYNTLYDRAPSSGELNTANPLSQVDSMLGNEAFQDVFARYVNAHMNWGPMESRNDNPVYNMVKNYILKRDLPWKELFTARVEVVGQNVNPKPDAAGYFEDRRWKKRYAGNEEDGYKLRTAYMIMNNIIGLKLEAITVTNDGGSAKSDRANPKSVCYSCHFASDFALDKVALILDRVNRQASDAQNTIFQSAEGPAQTIYGQKVANLGELVDMLVEMDDFSTNACRIAFNFVFGREEGGTEPAIFNGCIDKFKQSEKIVDAVKHFVESDLFCPGEGV